MIKKKKGTSINEKRAALAAKYEGTTFKVLKAVSAIAYKSAVNSEAKFDNLIELIADEGTLYQAIGNISKKKGALTPGPPMDKITVDGTSVALVKKLSAEIKAGTFRFNPVRRIYMDKSGKNVVTEEQRKKLLELHTRGKVTMDEIKELKVRPLGIPSFQDKVIQEALRIVLSAIYEPEFSKYECNFGFRPKHGCADAIQQVKAKAKSMDYAIEGDIKGAFDNVNHKTLMGILRKKIIDEKFLNLIWGGLKCGLIYLKFRQDSSVGTTQGSVVSPLLYNVYFHEFDKFIYNEFSDYLAELNKAEHRITKPVNKLHSSLNARKTRLGVRQKLALVKSIKEKPDSDLSKLKPVQEDLMLALKKYRELDREQKKIPYVAKSRQTIRFSYQRYADDWVFFTNASLERVQEWKDLFSKWIFDNLELTVEKDKTKITDLRKGGIVRFLGYQITRQGKRKRNQVVNVGAFIYKRTDLARRDQKKKIKLPHNESRIRFKTRAAVTAPIVAWDRSRVLPRLEKNSFIKKHGISYRGKSKNIWTTLREPEIILRYNSIIRGYVDYYAPVIHHATDLNYLFYLLKYSCIHTLAQKLKVSTRTVFKRFGKNVDIRYIEKIEKLNRDGSKTSTEKSKVVSLLNWEDVLVIARKAIKNTLEKLRKKQPISLVMKTVDEICNVKINWRTAYKLSQHCAICGSEDKVEYHHVKHIRKGKVTGFLQIMNQQNRKQIPCCRPCHIKIHKGLYDNLPLDQLYDEELIIL